MKVCQRQILKIKYPQSIPEYCFSEFCFYIFPFYTFMKPFLPLPPLSANLFKQPALLRKKVDNHPPPNGFFGERMSSRTITPLNPNSRRMLLTK